LSVSTFSFGHCVVCSSSICGFWLHGIFKVFLSVSTFSFGHCACSSSIYGFWLHLWYLQTLLVLLYFFFWPLRLFFDIRILITPLLSSNSSWNVTLSKMMEEIYLLWNITFYVLMDEIIKMCWSLNDPFYTDIKYKVEHNLTQTWQSTG
jgi:hypothetical protein